MAYSILPGQHKRANDSLRMRLGLNGTGRDYCRREREYSIACQEKNMKAPSFYREFQQLEIERNQLRQNLKRQSEKYADRIRCFEKESDEVIRLQRNQIRRFEKKLERRDQEIEMLYEKLYWYELKVDNRNGLLVNIAIKEKDEQISDLRHQLRKTLNKKQEDDAKMNQNIDLLTKKIALLEKEVEDLKIESLEKMLKSKQSEINGSKEVLIYKDREIYEQKYSLKQTLETLYKSDASLGGTVTSIQTKNQYHEDEKGEMGHRYLPVDKMVDNKNTEMIDANGQILSKAINKKDNQIPVARDQLKHDFGQINDKEVDLWETIYSLRAKLERREEEADRRELKIKDLEDNLNSKRMTIREIDELRQIIKAKDVKIYELRDQLQQTLQQNQEKETKLEELTKTSRHLEEEVKQRDRKVKDMENEGAHKRYINDKLLKEKNDQLSAQRNQLQHFSKQLEDKDKNISSLKKKIHDLEQEAGHRFLEVKGEVGTLGSKEIESGNENQPNKEVMQKEITELKKLLQQTQTKLRNTQTELDETKTRLSKAMGDRLTDNNPNIADLSDKNRPTKLAERYAELYDNQWTDAFDILATDFSREEHTVEALLKILQDAMGFCKKKGQEQMEDLQRVLEFSEKHDHKDISNDMRKVLKDSRKAMAAVAGGNLLQLYLSHLKGSTDKTVRTALKVSSFTKECLEICWFMAIQDPPVVFAPLLRRGSRFNTDLYKPYTSSGTHVAFVVWPALLLHESGPVLAKGVAQGYSKKYKNTT